MAMEPSIFRSTRQIVGLTAESGPYDLEILTHINDAFSTLYQIGATTEAVTIEDQTTNWSDLGLSDEYTNMIKTYIFLKVRSVWDPPNTSFGLNAMKEHIQEREGRLVAFREEEAYAAGSE